MLPSLPKSQLRREAWLPPEMAQLPGEQLSPGRKRVSPVVKAPKGCCRFTWNPKKQSSKRRVLCKRGWGTWARHFRTSIETLQDGHSEFQLGKKPVAQPLHGETRLWGGRALWWQTLFLMRVPDGWFPVLGIWESPAPAHFWDPV